MEDEPAHLGMVEPHLCPAPRPHIVPGPEPAESRAGEGELANQLDGTRRVDLHTDGLAEPGDQADRGEFPVRKEGALSRVQEEVAEPIRAGCEAWRECGGQRIGRQHVEIAPLDERREWERRHERSRAGRHVLSDSGTPSRPSLVRSEGEKISGAFIAELQYAGEGFQDLGRRLAIPALFQPQVVVGADAGEHRDFLAAQTWDPPNPEDGDAGLLRGDELPTGTQVVAQQILLVAHATTVVSAAAIVGGPVTPRNTGTLADVWRDIEHGVMTQQRVLVTGGSGFIAGHLILQLLEHGYLVRTTVRSLHRENAVRQVLNDAGMVDGESLSFVAADLTDDAGWAEAVAGVDVVAHVASPVLPGHVDNEDDVIVPAREGTLRVLRAARGAGVRRVVLTSAFHAVGWGHPHDEQVFTEEDWTVLDGPGVDAYAKAKTLAERAAWDFVGDQDGTPELVTMLPVAVMGPVMGAGISGANQIVQSMLTGTMPGFPDIHIPIVDVRDVAAAHVAAIETPAAAGQRFLLSNGSALPMREIGNVLSAHLGAAAAKVPNRRIPGFVVQLGALFSSELRSVAPDLGYARRTSNEKARRVLDWQPRSPEEAIVAAGQSMVTGQLVGAKGTR